MLALHSPRFFAALLLTLLAWQTATLSADEPQKTGDKSKSVVLFNGKNFDGWDGDTEKSFHIQDGAIVAGSLKEKVPRNEFLSTKREFGDFELNLQFKLLGGGANAGVQIRSKRIPDHHEMIGYQADMGDLWWGCLYDESRRNKVLARPKPEDVTKALKRDDWNRYRIRCEGKRIRTWINDVPMIDYTEMDDKIEQRGTIAVQIHGGPPSEAWYKDLVLQEL